MTAKQLANVILRLLSAVWTLSVLLGNVLVEIVWLIVAIIVFFNSEQIANFLFAGNAEQLSIAATARQLQELGFSLIAVYLGVSAAGRVTSLIYEFIRVEPDMDESRIAYLARTRTENLASAAVQLIVCIALFFGSKALARFWARLRARDEK